MIYVIRHGQTHLNSRKALQGRSDAPLNETGVEQAREAAQLLAGVHFDTVYSSPLIRAVQTAEIIAPGIDVQVDNRLIEMDYGPYEGMPLDDPAPEVSAFFADFAHVPAPEGMEPLASVVERAGAFLEERCRTSKNVLISTHAIAMKGILEHLMPESPGYWWSHFIGNCEIYTIEYRGGSFCAPLPLVSRS